MTRALVVGLALVAASAAAGAQPRRRPPRAPATPAPPEFISVTVRPRETCADVARRVYRAPTRTEVIHQFNPRVCPPQRRLTAGLVLRLPRRLPPPPRPAPVAFLTALSRGVRVQTQAAAPPRDARADDALFRGTRVSTERQSTAELTFRDETQLRLDESTLVVILGDTNTRVRRTATARDTTLVNGSLRAFLGALAHGAASPEPPVIQIVGRRRPPRPRPRPRVTQVAINTAGGRAILRDGESQLSVAEGARASTTLTVYRGSGQLRSGRQVVTVPEGFGARAEAGAPIAPVHRLPSAPAWAERPPRIVLADEPHLRGAWSPGPPAAGQPEGPAPASWHVQVARDEAFGEVAQDERPPREGDHLDAALPGGAWFVRVSAEDGDRFEGPFGELARVAVVPLRTAPTEAPYLEDLAVPAGVDCALDGEPVVAPSTVVIDRRRAHALRCAPAGEPEAAVEATLARTARSYTVTASLEDADPAAGRGSLRLRVVDARAVPYAEPAFALDAGDPAVTFGAPALVDPARGDWVVPLRWARGATGLRLRGALDGGDRIEAAELALPRPPPPPVAPEGFAQRLSLRGEGLYANMLSTYQRNDDPSTAGVYMGNAKAITHGLAGSLRLGLDLRRPPPGATGVRLGLEVFGAGVVFPRGDETPGVASMFGAGLRLTPFTGRAQPWVSAGAGVVFTGGLARFGVDLGLGLDVRVGRAVTIGPVLRYVHVLEPGGDAATAALDEDARMLQVGLGMSVRIPAAR